MSINYNCYNPVSAAPIADSRKGCPYEVRGLKFVRIFERRTKFAPTVCKTSFSEEFMPLSRHRCVEVAAPYKPRVNEFVRVLWADDIRLYRALFHYSLLIITLSEAKQPLSLGLRRAGFPAGEPNRFRSKSHLHMLNNIMRHQYIQKNPRQALYCRG